MSKVDFGSQIKDPRRQKATAIRLKTEAAVREFFNQQNFIETPTPSLVSCPGMEPHIRPFQAGLWGKEPHLSHLKQVFLHTSPEFAMKKLLAGGLTHIYQMARVYRAEIQSSTHLPEFTLLEWYSTQIQLKELMDQCESLLQSVCQTTLGDSRFKYGDHQVDLSAQSLRLRVPDLFQEFCSIDLGKCLELAELQTAAAHLDLPSDPKTLDWDDLYFSIWLNLIEPKLDPTRLTFVYDYPPSQAALSKIKVDSAGQPWAQRFEIYVAGVELANAFEELTDANEQRARFEKDMQYREQKYKEDLPRVAVDEEFLSAVEQLPDCCGIALGLDRLVMLLSDEPDIQKTVWLT